MASHLAGLLRSGAKFLSPAVTPLCMTRR